MVRKSQRLKRPDATSLILSIFIDVVKVIHKHVTDAPVSFTSSEEIHDTSLDALIKRHGHKPYKHVHISDERAAINNKILALRDRLDNTQDPETYVATLEKIKALYEQRSAEENNGKEKAYH